MTKATIAALAIVCALGMTACSTSEQATVGPDKTVPGAKAPSTSTANAPASSNPSSAGMYYSDNRITHRTGLNGDPKDPSGTGVEDMSSR